MADDLFLPKVGDVFELKIPWPPSMQTKYGPFTTVLARREPDLSDEEVQEQLQAGILKQLYQIVEFDTHRIVTFAGHRWVYDFLGHTVKFKGAFRFTDVKC